MRYIKTVAAAGLLAVAAGGYAVVRTFHGPGAHGTNVAGMVAHVSELFPRFAAFDANKDGQLNGGEKESLAKAVADGSLALPPNTPPPDRFPTEEARLDHLVEMYGRFAAYDVNRDGALDTGEQAAVRGAIDHGELSFLKEHAQGKSHPAHQMVKSLHGR